ncbi:MAG: glycosyltransferase family 4 protein [Candidatus Buchananbacteria bacterium]
MKILMLTSRYGFGYGMGYSAYKEAIAFADLNNSVTVVHCYNSPEIEIFSDSRIKTVYLPIIKIPLIGFFIYYFKLRSFLKDKFQMQEFDLIYIQSLEFGLIDMKKIKIPIFYFARSTMIGLQKTLQGEGIKKSFLDTIIHNILVCLEKRCMRYAKLIFVKSSAMAKEVESLYDISSQKIITATGGIDDINFKINNSTFNNDLKKKLSIPPSAKIILYAGRIVPQKGLIYLVKASLQLLKNYNFVVIVAGSYTDQNYMHSIIKLLENNIHKKSFYFLGHINQTEISSIFNIADCVVTPSLYEPFGMVNLQAAFLSKAVITTDITGSIDVLRNYHNLRVIQPGSVKAIEVSLKKILSTQENFNMQSFDFSQYSWMNVAKKILSYFKKY